MLPKCPYVFVPNLKLHPWPITTDLLISSLIAQTFYLQPLEEVIKTPKFHTKPVKPKKPRTPKTPKSPKTPGSPKLSPKPSVESSAEKSPKSKKVRKLDKALVQLEKLEFPTKVIIINSLIDFKWLFSFLLYNNRCYAYHKSLL